MKHVKLFGWLFRLVSLLFISALLIASIASSSVSAQSPDDSWAEPQNLSHSGFGKNPAFVIDSDGKGHVIWLDDLGNFMYTQLDGDQWSPPEMTDLNRLFGLPIPGEPTRGAQSVNYTGPNPILMAGSDQIFAFWISPEGRLFLSRVVNTSFNHFGAWDSERVIAHQAASFAGAVDMNGEWHLAFIRTVEDPQHPAGIYYTHSKNGGWSWAVPRLLYESPYIRRLAEGQASLSLATAGTEDSQHVYLAWDNRARKQVYLAHSADGGESWEQPALVTGPAPDSELAEPSNIQVGANQNSVVLVWQNGHETDGLLPTCSQIYQSSSDAGATWSNPQPMIEELMACEQSNQFVTRSAQSVEGPLYFMTKTKGKIYLSAWNGHQWSPAQEQPILSGFEEPEIFTEVVYGCQRASLLAERLYIVGCDEGAGGDVWVTSRDLGPNSSLFKQPIWSQLSPVTSGNLQMEAIELVATDDGLFHAFFTQHENPAIYYTYWNGESWSRITPVLELPDGEAAWPAIATGPENELFLITQNNRGEVYFSRATSGNTGNKSLWSTPTRLEIGDIDEIGSVDVVQDSAGTVYVVYSVPVNEARGIYLVQSKDHGASWSEPLKVFDGATANFDLVGAPSLLISENDSLHITWKRQSIRGDEVPESLSLYYTRSEDGGRTFTDAVPIVEEPVAWREILMDGKGNLHLLWKPQDAITTVWFQVSSDDGRTWQYPQGLPNEGGPAAVTRDPAGRLHLVSIVPGVLEHWLWDGSRWQSEAPLRWPLSSQQESPLELLAAAVNNQGNVMVVMAEPASDGNAMEKTLLYSNRTLQLPPNQTVVQKDPTPTELPLTSTQATPTPARLLTPTSMVEIEPTTLQDQLSPNESSGRFSPLTMALVPVALILLTVVGFVIARAARARDR